jgi:hypothetical protein
MARTRRPKVGILVECGRRGLEDVVCRRLCTLLREHTGLDFEDDIVTMDNKRNLIQTCGAVTAALFASGCDRVVILWDERPAWPKAGERLCWHNELAAGQGRRSTRASGLHRTGVRVMVVV